MVGEAGCDLSTPDPENDSYVCASCFWTTVHGFQIGLSRSSLALRIQCRISYSLVLSGWCVVNEV